MTLPLLFIKTSKGLQEVETRNFNLSADLRFILILIDGKRTSPQLIKQFIKVGSVETLLETLWNQGFIEAQTSVSGLPAAAESIAIPPSSSTGLPAIKASLDTLIRQHFGLMAGPLTNKLAKCDTLEELYEYVAYCQNLIQESFNIKKAIAFAESVKTLLP
ncbi:MAG: hypothetical protein V9G63_15230 [Candidatus Competibacter sp.]